ncbi:MAG: response regulator [Planctomycetota bacterium]
MQPMVAIDNQRKSSSILVVDDEPVVGRVVSRYLRDEGYTDVVFLSDPELVLDWLNEFQPQLVLLDIYMPGITGLELLQQIRADHTLDNVIVLMLSSAGQEERFQALEMGAMGFIQKPTTQEELNAQIQRTLKVASRVRKL